MNLKISWCPGPALPVLLVCAALTACGGKTTTSSVGQTAVAMLRFNASDGTPDTSLTGGSGGLVTTDVNPSRNDLAFAVVLQADGKIIAVGNTTPANSGIAVIRYNTNGTLDPTFGSGGTTVTSLPSTDVCAFAATLQTDGKLLVAGRFSTSTGSGLLLLRYHTNISTGTPGTLDTASFGGTLGYAMTAIPNGSDTGAEAIALSGTNILIAGHSRIGGKYQIALAQYTTGGVLDTTSGFGSGTGIVTTQIGSGDADAAALAVQTDGKIVAAGLAGSVATNVWDVALLRYNAAGTLDTTFGGDGIVTTTGAGLGSNYANAVALQADGKIVVVGNAFANPFAGTSDIAVLRYDNVGALDPTFGSGSGFVTTDVSQFDNGFAVALQADNKIVVAGNSNAGAGDRLALLRYNGDGSLDSGFGAGGIVSRAASGPSTVASANAVILQPVGGAIVVAGYD